MTLSLSQLKTLPLFSGISDDDLAQIYALFDEILMQEGDILFGAGDVGTDFFILEEGEVELQEDGALRVRIHPPAPIGEVGALTALSRNTTAVITRPSRLCHVSSETLLGFFEAHSEIASPFYHDLLKLVAHKIQRDQTRLEDMRKNIIRTQKAMKQLRDYLLESQDTPVSDRLHDTLEGLIRQNRRVNYRVNPPEQLNAFVRFDDSDTAPVVEISRTHFSFISKAKPEVGKPFSCVLLLGSLEIPVSGIVLRHIEQRIDIELDLLIDEYSASLDGYLTRVQLLDFMV